LLVEKIPGDMLEVGVYRGWSAALIHHYIPERELFLFDTFEGFTDRCLKSEKQETGWDYPQGELSDTSLEIAMKNVDAENGNVHWFKGYFPDTWPAELNDRRFAFVHFDPDLYEPIHKGLELVYPRMVRHGMILVHDYMNLPGAFKAVNDFFSDKPEVAIPMPDKTGSALIVKE
jgi:O-methyltransferase